MTHNSPLTTIHIIAGPTASGKSARALEIARKADGVIINCDSVQIYEGLPLLSAQPSREEQGQAPHLLYGVLHPNEICSAGHWRSMVIPVIEEVLAQGRTPIICGGSGLYIKALVEGLSPMPAIPDDIRARAIEMQKTLSAEEIHALLQSRDPAMAARLDPKNKARMVRALEVLEATGKSLGAWQELPLQGPPAHWKFETEIIMPERETLYERCNARFVWMMEHGALEEAAAFAARIESGEIGEDVPATKALGFKELRAHLNGEMSLEEAITAAQASTRHYAKRQTTWFRNQV